MYKKFQKECEHCHNLYLGNKNNKYCSYNCSHAARRKRITHVCKECNKSFEVQEWYKDAKFCSYSCKNKNQSSKLIELHCTNCNKLFKRKEHLVYRRKSGKSFCCKKCSDEFNKGINHYEYKENLHDKHVKLALKQWSVEIKKRQNYTCQKCGESNRKLLEVHHIKSRSLFPDLQFDYDNGIILCLKCHSEEHIDDNKSYRLIISKLKRTIT